jgi:hypothetical protein
MTGSLQKAVGDPVCALCNRFEALKIFSLKRHYATAG